MNSIPNQPEWRLSIFRKMDDTYSLVVLADEQNSIEPYVLCTQQGKVLQIAADQNGLYERAISECLSYRLAAKHSFAHYNVITVEGGYKCIVTLPGHRRDDYFFATLEVADTPRTRTYATEQNARLAGLSLVSWLGAIASCLPQDDYMWSIHPVTL